MDRNKKIFIAVVIVSILAYLFYSQVYKKYINPETEEIHEIILDSEVSEITIYNKKEEKIVIPEKKQKPTTPKDELINIPQTGHENFLLSSFLIMVSLGCVIKFNNTNKI